MNKVKAIIIILTVSLSLTGCSYGGANNVVFSIIDFGVSLWIDKNATTLENPNEYGSIVLKAIENEDVESIRNIMCPYIRENFKSLDDDIKGMFEFIDGKIISYDGPVLDFDGGDKDYWEFIEKYSSSDIHNAKTDTGHLYYISVGITEVDKNHEGYEGVNGIIVIDEERQAEKGGYEDGAIYNLGYEEMYMDE